MASDSDPNWFVVLYFGHSRSSGMSNDITMEEKGMVKSARGKKCDSAHRPDYCSLTYI